MKTGIFVICITISLFSVFAICASSAYCSTERQATHIGEFSEINDHALPTESADAERSDIAFLLRTRFEALSLLVLGSVLLFVATTVNLVLSRKAKLNRGESTR